MKNKNRSETIRCFVIIAIIAVIVSIIDLIARAYFYEQAQGVSFYLPLLIGGVSLCLIAMMKQYRKNKDAPASQTNMAGIRRVRVTGTIK